MAPAQENKAAWLPAAKVTPLEISAAPYPTPGAGQLVLRNRAVAINSVDWAKQLMGDALLSHIPYPFVLGSDVAGTVAAIGPGVTRFRVGDRVLASSAAIISTATAEGGFQLYPVVREWLAAPLPDHVSFEQACVLPLSILTAAYGLFDPGYLGLRLPTAAAATTPRPAVIITGGASSVGSTAVQLAVAAGYEVVATASPKNFDYVKKLGAAHVFDYKSDTVVADLLGAVRGHELAGGYSIGDGSIALLTAVLTKHEGTANKFIALAGGAPGDTEGLDAASVEVKFINLQDSVNAGSVVAKVFEDYLPQALADGKFVPAPAPEVVGEGLDQIQVAFGVHMQGVSAKKIVVSL